MWFADNHFSFNNACSLALDKHRSATQDENSGQSKESERIAELSPTNEIYNEGCHGVCHTNILFISKLKQ